jgi:stress response protein SCP2
VVLELDIVLNDGDVDASTVVCKEFGQFRCNVDGVYFGGHRDAMSKIIASNFHTKRRIVGTDLHAFEKEA